MKTIKTYYGQPILETVKGISAGKEVDFGVFDNMKAVNLAIKDFKEFINSGL